MTNDGLNTLVYDSENRGVSASNGSSGGAYVYDGNGLRVKKCVPNCTSPTTTTVYLFSGSKVIAEYVNGAAVASPSREYIYAGGALLAKIDSTGTKYYHQDHLSNRLVTDSSGNTSAQLGHFPYGESWYNASGDKLLFTTYERDAESGNDYAMARYHVNRLARFSSPDPLAGSIANPQSLSRYAYTTNDPTDLVDPSGLTDCPGGHFGCPGWSPGDPGADLSGEFGRDLWGWADFWGGDAAVESRLSSGFLIRSDTVLVAGYVCEEVSGVAGEVCYNTADGSSGPYGADPGGAFGQAKKQALDELTAKKCKDFVNKILKALSKAGQTLSASQLGSTVQKEQQNVIPTQPPDEPFQFATASPPNTVNTYPYFDKLTPQQQGTALIHEAFHLSPFKFTDLELAKAAYPLLNWTPKSNASGWFSTAVQANCLPKP